MLCCYHSLVWCVSRGLTSVLLKNLNSSIFSWLFFFLLLKYSCTFISKYECYECRCYKPALELNLKVQPVTAVSNVFY